MAHQIKMSTSRAAHALGDILSKKPSIISKFSLDSETGQIAIPTDLVPYLKRISTKDIMRYMQDKTDSRRDVTEHVGRRCASNILNGRYFDIAMGLVIVFNLIVMIIETDRSASEEDTSGVHWTEVIGWIVLLIFIFEVVIRLVVLKCGFWDDIWNVLDFIIVTLDAIFSVLGLLAGSTFPVSILRIFRLTKLARVFKVLRVFPELRLLLAGLVSAISAIFWGSCLLFLTTLVWSFVAVVLIHPLGKSIDFDGCERCPRAYSSVMHAMLTFWQTIVTGDSWGSYTVPYLELYPSTGLFFIAVYLSIGMAVTNLILGVVVNVAQQAQDALNMADSAERALDHLGTHTHLLKLCKDMDTDRDGMIAKSEIYAAFEAPGDFRETILALDITREDFNIIWTIIDAERKGSVSYKELVSRLSSMKTSDSTFLLSYIKYYITVLKQVVLEKLEVQAEAVMQAEQNVEKIEQEEKQILSTEQEILEQIREPVQELEEVGDEINGPQSQDITGEAFSTGKQEATMSNYKAQNSSTKTPASRKPTRKLTSGREVDQVLPQLNQLHDNVAALRAELKHILTDMDLKLDRQAARYSSMDLDIWSSRAHSDLVVVPARTSMHNCSPTCFKTVPAQTRQA